MFHSYLKPYEITRVANQISQNQFECGHDLSALPSVNQQNKGHGRAWLSMA